MAEEPQGSTKAESLDHSWESVSEEIIAGIGHDLSDRLSSLYGIVQLGELEQSIEGGVGESIRSELDRVLELIELLRAIPRPRAEGIEPIRLTDLLPTIGALLGRHRGLEGTELRSEAVTDPLVAGVWTDILRQLLRTVSSVALRAGADGGQRTIRLDLCERGAEVIVTISASGVREVLSLPAFDSAGV